jgi:hypothetical protein
MAREEAVPPELPGNPLPWLGEDRGFSLGSSGCNQSAITVLGPASVPDQGTTAMASFLGSRNPVPVR